MNLPPDYLTVVSDGVAALRAIGGRVRSEAVRRSDAPELWLVVRDLEGLAHRIGEMDPRLWEDGFLDLFVTGQDFGVLDELLGEGVLLRDTTVVSPTPEETASVARLRGFLRRYCDRAFETKPPDARRRRGSPRP